MNYYPVLILGFMGFAAVFLLLLIPAGVNLKKKQVLELLPGTDCKACGFESCVMYAGSLMEKPGGAHNACSVIAPEINEKISALTGSKTGLQEPSSAVVFCAGGNVCRDKYYYKGVKTCSASSKIFRGKKECIYGCIGYGDCARACVFNAISHNQGEVPVINKEICNACGLCVKVCPKNIIALVPEKYDVHIKCSSLDAGGYVREICKTGCISCGICVKICPTKAIKIENNRAIINYSKCSNCGLCVDRCPANTIERILPVV